MADEWFRSPEWTPAAQANFEARLARSRAYNRAQYMRIKGLALREAGHIDGARELWTRVLETEIEHWPQVSGSLEHLGDSYRQDDPVKAEGHYRRLPHSEWHDSLRPPVVGRGPARPWRQGVGRRGSQAPQHVDRPVQCSLPKRTLPLQPRADSCGEGARRQRDDPTGRPHRARPRRAGSRLPASRARDRRGQGRRQDSSSIAEARQVTRRTDSPRRPTPLTPTMDP